MDQVLNAFVFIMLVMLLVGILPVFETVLILAACYFLLPQLDALAPPF